MLAQPSQTEPPPTRPPRCRARRLKRLFSTARSASAPVRIRDPAIASTWARPSPSRCLSPSRPRRRRAHPLDIVFEDDQLIVIDKPAGLVVHPAAGHATGTLVNALIAHCGDSLSGIGGVKRPGIVHRLDKDTTGLMVVAKTDRAHQSLAAQFADMAATGPLRRGLSGVRLGRAGPAQRHHRRAARPPSEQPRPHGGPPPTAAWPSPIGRCWSASTARTAKRAKSRSRA